MRHGTTATIAMITSFSSDLGLYPVDSLRAQT